MKAMLMSPEKVKQSLAISDLTDPKNGVHAINLAVERIKSCLSGIQGWPIPDLRRSDSPISSVANDFDRLYFPMDSLSRSPVYTRYITETAMLRTHTTAMIPNILAEMKKNGLSDYAVLCPGICYRRDVVDKRHTGEPHQMDIWRIRKREPKLQRQALIDLIEIVIGCVMPNAKYRANEVTHPYTINGLEVEIMVRGEWLELLECGEAHPRLLADCGLDPDEYSGLAMGIGLDRAVMLIKNIDDIRILRSEDPRIKKQMADLKPYTHVSKYPAIRQDMSIAVAMDTALEDVCETVRDVMGADASAVEEVKLVSETPYDKLPLIAIERLGIRPGQKNLLISVILRSHERSLLHEEANEIRDRLYRALHEGDKGYVPR